MTANGTLQRFDINNAPEPAVRYLKAIKIFQSAIEKLGEEDKQHLSQHISQKCVVIFLATQTFEDAFRLFVIVNDRGKQLRRIDILKSTNISPDVIANNTLREKLANDWEDQENDVGEVVFESVFHLWRLILLKDKPQGDLVKEFNDRIFGKHVQKGEKFVTSLCKYIALYKSVFIDKDILDVANPSRIKFRALVHIMDTQFEASEWRACVLLFCNKLGSEKLYEFLLLIEKKYLELWSEGVRKDERFGEYATILGIIDASKNASDVCSAMKHDRAATLKMVENQNLYGAGYCKYVLLRLELLASELDVDKFFDAKSIEHVLPQNPDLASDWLKKHDAAEMKNYVNTVGNLVLLSKGKNSSAGNREFEDKKNRYLQSRVSDYPRSIEVLSKPEWTKAIIEERNKSARDTFLNDP